MKSEKIQTLVLASLVVLDVVLAAVGYLFPDFWFSVFHGVPYQDPQGLLRRSAGNWLAFALVQAVALARHKKAPHWLAVVAGVRLSDVFTDLSYLVFAQNITPLGGCMLACAGPMNLLLGLYLLRAFRAAQASRAS